MSRHKLRSYTLSVKKELPTVASKTPRNYQAPTPSRTLLYAPYWGTWNHIQGDVGRFCGFEHENGQKQRGLCQSDSGSLQCNGDHAHGALPIWGSQWIWIQEVLEVNILETCFRILLSQKAAMEERRSKVPSESFSANVEFPEVHSENPSILISSLTSQKCQIVARSISLQKMAPRHKKHSQKNTLPGIHPINDPGKIG